jgi:hypothetical protein
MDEYEHLLQNVVYSGRWRLQESGYRRQQLLFLRENKVVATSPTVF